MPVPPEYLRVGEFFSDFLLRVREETMLPTRHQAYTCLQGVLTAFRRRLNAEQILMFAQILPPAVASIFIDGWTESEFTSDWGSRESLTREVQHLRQEHNFATDTAIADVARALRKTVGDEPLDRILAGLGPEAEAYWAT
jgi:uncharacterized protein (DUF2267 family)